MILAAFGDQAHGTFADFGGILYGFLHGSIFSRVGASTKSGAVQCDEGAPLFTVRVDGAVGRHIAYTRIQTRFRPGKRKNR
jgi:hypothetical protein